MKSSLVMVSTLLALVPLSVPITATAEDEPESLGVTSVALPPAPAGLTIAGVALDGASAYVGMRTTWDSPRSLYRTPADGSGDWQVVVDPATDAPLQYRDRMPSIDSGVILAELPYDAELGCRHRLVTGPGEYRTLTGCRTRTLGLGGRTVASIDTGSPYLRTVEDLQGNVLDSGTPGARATLPTVADGRIFEVTGERQVTSRVLGSASVERTYTAPRSCSVNAIIGMRGPYLVADCANGPAAVFRTDADLPPYPVPGSRSVLSVGAGFTVRLVPEAVDRPSRIDVTDLGVDGSVLEIPGLPVAPLATDRGETSAFIAAFAPDDVDVVTVSGLSEPASLPVDTVAPVVDTVTGPGPVVPAYDEPIFRWTGADPGHPEAVSFETRHRTWPRGTEPPAWSEPVSTAGTGVLVAAAGGDDACMEVRAVDWAGNRSEWTGACTFVDRTKPTMAWRGPSGPHYLEAPASAPYRLSWTGRDNDRVASYDIDYRIARAGQSMSSWISPPEWSALTTPYVDRVYPPGAEVCFRGKATDRAGLTGVEDFPNCLRTPFDDRHFKLERSARRGFKAGAYDGTVTVMRPGDRVVRSGVRARFVRVRFQGLPDGSCVTAYLGGVSDRTCGGYFKNGARYITMTFPRRVEGTLRIKIGPNFHSESPNRIYLLDAVWAVQ